MVWVYNKYVTRKVLYKLREEARRDKQRAVGR